MRRFRRLVLVLLAVTAAPSPMIDAATGGVTKGVENLHCALINSTEFHTNH